MGPSGIAIIIEAITDNSNRTINEIKHMLTDHEAKMVPENSLNWMFDKNWLAISPVEVPPEVQQKIDNLLETLDTSDDVENIYTNLVSDSH